MHFRTFRLQPPHAPPFPGHTSCSGRAWPPVRFPSLPAVLRTSFITGSLISRIRPNRVCFAGVQRPSVLRTILSFPVALHTASPRCSYFPLVAVSSATEGLSPSHAHSLSSAPVFGLWPKTSAPRDSPSNGQSPKGVRLAGGTPARATGTVALLISIASFRLRGKGPSPDLRFGRCSGRL